MRKILQNIIGLSLAFVMLFSSSAYAVSLADVYVPSAPLVIMKAAQNGMVRVYLSSLGSPTYLTLTVSGSYSLSNGASLSSGESVSVSFNTASGAITLTRGGSTYNMGSSCSIRRHSTADGNGIRIAQARQPSNLYPGDIEFRAVGQSTGGYKLYAIAHVYIENYLYGVVPYEMGSSAPMEALKAQAVAARTYTVRMMSSRVSWMYDVVDTTGDQTYNGTPASVTNCNAAVDGTRGIVLKNGSNYTATYYSSSNGGQTESIWNAWGTSGYAYLGVQDDPFDYANPASVVKEATVYRDAHNASNNASLISLLQTKAVAALSAAGYSATAYNTALQTIGSIQPHTPMYAAPSKLYTKLNFSLTATTYNSGGALVTVTTTVTCDIFSELESMLGLSIQSGQNELWSVAANDSTLKIQARRYGHGIGMSQRGAMYMGQLGYTYDEIVGFYYPGCTRIGCTFTNTILSPETHEDVSTEEDPVEITDDDSADIRGIVTLSGYAQLAVRNARSSSAAVLIVLSNGTPVNVLANDGSWCKIEFGSIVGYVPTNTLSISGTAPASDDTAVSVIDGFAVVTASGYLNLRESGSYSAAILSTAPGGAIVTVLAWGGTWAHIQYGMIVAYAASDYLSFSAEYPEAIQEPDGDDEPVDTDEPDESETLTAIVTTQSGSLNMRQFPQAGSRILTTIPRNTVVTVTSRGDTWTGVRYLGLDGYVMTVFLTFLGPDDTDTPDDTDPDDETPVTAVVNTSSGSLNLRAEALADSQVLARIPRGTTIPVLQRLTTWTYTCYQQNYGYVMNAYLIFSGGTDSQPPLGDPVTAIVVTDAGSLNLRDEPYGNVVAIIPQHAVVDVYVRGTDWCYLRYQGVFGYVMTAYLSFETDDLPDDEDDDTPTPPVVPPPGESATVTVETGSLNLRAGRSETAEILTTIPNGTVVTVLLRANDWCKIQFEILQGYVQTRYLAFGSPSSSPANPDMPVKPYSLTAWVDTDSGSLNLRETASADAAVIAQIPQHAQVEVLSDIGAAWCRTRYGNAVGYVMTAYLTTSQPTSGPEPTESQDDGKPEAPDADGGTPMDPTLHAPDAEILVFVRPPAGFATLPLYDACSEDSLLLQNMAENSPVEIIRAGDTWCEVLYNDQLGYCLRDGLSFFAE